MTKITSELILTVFSAAFQSAALICLGLIALELPLRWLVGLQRSTTFVFPAFRPLFVVGLLALSFRLLEELVEARWNSIL